MKGKNKVNRVWHSSDWSSHKFQHAMYLAFIVQYVGIGARLPYWLELVTPDVPDLAGQATRARFAVDAACMIFTRIHTSPPEGVDPTPGSDIHGGLFLLALPIVT